MPIWLETTLYVTARLNLLLGAWVYRIDTTSFVLPTVHRAIQCSLCSPLSTMLSTVHHAIQNRSRKQKILRDSFGSQRIILASSWTLGATGRTPVNCGSPVCRPLGILLLTSGREKPRVSFSRLSLVLVAPPCSSVFTEAAWRSHFSCYTLDFTCFLPVQCSSVSPVSSGIWSRLRPQS